MSGYRGRFAPSPSGPLHAGSLVAALASWLDARAHRGRWLVRIEDVDTPRCQAGADAFILSQLADCGLFSDEPPVRQSDRVGLYQAALDRLAAAGSAYPCGCSRREIAQANAALGRPAPRHGERVYPGTCRAGLNGRPARAWRFRLPQETRATSGPAADQPAAPGNPAPAVTDAEAGAVCWTDRWLGPQSQQVAREVGDFVLRRADGLWAYQLAVVADDADQRITDVVRGEDLVDSTARQILLQRALGALTPRYLHTPLVRTANGEKLSKQNGAAALDTRDALAALNAAASMLGLGPQSGCTAGGALAAWIGPWRERCGGGCEL